MTDDFIQIIDKVSTEDLEKILIERRQKENKNVIHLNKDNILRLGIKTYDGQDTGEFLEFDLEDIELPLRYQDLMEKDKQNRKLIKNQLLIIDKRKDVKGKKMMSKNEEDKMKAINEFFKKEVEIYNMFLGKNGVQKLLNGRKLGWTSLREIDDIIEKQISPHINIKMSDITDKIEKKYGVTDTEKNVIKMNDDNE